ncbi:MAG TPA: hypothetical protein DEO84_00325 [candidate division Zixibacteria bacterium]|nr:hypothetical protein [candidate division Zixibacteria bacterium]HBY99740.1 hypothetical protein [candidate division Zixibacteria bacterium]
MQCPKCGSSMRSRVKHKIEIDECTDCKSLWFDVDELRKIKDSIDKDLNWMDFDIWKNEKEFTIVKNPRKCPHCNIEMVTISYGSTNVEIDYCHKCGGILLDKGELLKIIEHLENELLTKNVHEYWKATLLEAKEIVTGKEGLISEWKDFKTVLRMMEYRILTENPKLAKTIATAQGVNPIR